MHNDPTMDLAHLRDLLGLLRDMGVAGFSAGGISVTFQDKAELEDDDDVPLRGRTVKEVKEDEDRSTSSRLVSGFGASKEGWRNPSLWPSQAGRVLKLDGTFEE